LEILGLLVCSQLFWISIGVVFSCVSPEALGEFREKLARSWHLVTLQARKRSESENDQERAGEMRDWLLGAVPVMVVQAIFRLAVDVFESDRAQLIMYAEPLLDKLMLIVHYEVSGFQLNVETARKARRRLFVRRVIQNPHVNQREHEKAHNDSQKVLNTRGPLVFGNQDALPLDDHQIELVMTARADGADSRAAKTGRSLVGCASEPGLGLPAIVNTGIALGATGQADMQLREGLQTWGGPVEDLSVERYDKLTRQGCEMLSRHLDDLEKTSDEHVGFLAMMSTSCFSQPSTSGGSKRTSDGDGENQDVDEEDLPKERRTVSIAERVEKFTPTGRLMERRKSCWKPHSSIILLTTRLSLGAEKREQEQAKMRRQEDDLREKIVSEALPPDLSVRELVTTWVSPQVQRLTHVEDKGHVLHKTAADAHRLRMTQSSPCFLPAAGKNAARGQAQRATDLGASVGSVGGGPSSKASAAATASPEDRSAKKPLLPRLGQANTSSGEGATAGFGRRRTAKKDEVSAAVHTLPHAVSASRALATVTVTGALAGGLHTSHAEYISLEPPQCLKSQKVIRRLEVQMETFHENSFGVYMKEYDIYMGGRKQHCDHALLQSKEAAYDKMMWDLVGPESRPLSFSQTFNKFFSTRSGDKTGNPPAM